MTTNITAHFDGQVLVPDGPVDLPIGQTLRVQVEIQESASAAVDQGVAIDLAARGIDQRQAADLRHRLQSFADDWNRPEMDVYDAL